jgi:hypothetical protein
LNKRFRDGIMLFRVAARADRIAISPYRIALSPYRIAIRACRIVFRPISIEILPNRNAISRYSSRLSSRSNGFRSIAHINRAHGTTEHTEVNGNIELE